MYNYIFRCIYKLHAPRSLNRSHGILLEKKNDLAGRKFLTLKMIWHGLTPPRNIIPISFMTSRAYLIETIRIENIPKHWPIIEYNHYTILA